MPQPLKRILYMVNAFEPDAPTRLAVACAEAARNTGRYECRIVALSRSGDLSTEITRRFGNSEVIALRSPLNARGWSRLAKAFTSFQPDIAHTTLALPTLYGIPAARIAGVKRTVITQHGVHEWREKGVLAGLLVPPVFCLVARRADVTVAVSQSTRDDLARLGIANRRLRVIHNGVDAGHFSPQAREERDRTLQSLFPSDTPAALLLVGAAGNLRPVKGHLLLVEAAARIAGKWPSTRFVVWGEGPERTRLEQRVAALGLSGRFALPGHTAGPASAYASCDVFVQPSLSESFGLAAVEAMSCGVAVVASRVGGLPELVLPGQTGLLFERGDVRQLAETIDRLLSDSALRAAFGAAARRRVLDSFAITRMLQQYVDLYDELSGPDA